MKLEEKFEALYIEVEKMASKMSGWSKGNKNKAFRIYISISILSALITLFVAIENDINEKFDLVIKSTILICSGLTTILAAWEGFFNHKQLWVNYGETSGMLRALQLRIKLLSDEEKKDQELFDRLYQDYQSTLNNNNDKWIQLRSDDSKSN